MAPGSRPEVAGFGQGPRCGPGLVGLIWMVAWISACAWPDRSPPAGTPEPPAASGPAAEAPAKASGPLIEMMGLRIPVIVVKTRSAREQFAVPEPPGPGWQSPVDRLARCGRDGGVLYAYPSPRRRPLAFRDAAGRSLVVAYLDGDGRVVGRQQLKLGVEYRQLDVGIPIRYLLFLRPGSAGAERLRIGALVRLPPQATSGAEEECLPAPGPDSVRIRVGEVPLRVDVADSPAGRLRGMMYRHRVPEGTGMLFLYPEDDVLSYWMLNTRVPLDVAYIDGDRVIRKIARLEPFDLGGRSSEVPVRMALEVPAGWFERHGIREGDRVTLLTAGRDLEAGPVEEPRR